MPKKNNIVAESFQELPDGTVAEDSEVIGTSLVTEPQCEVGTDMGATVNIGNFSNVKCGVSIKMPCAMSEVDEAFELASEWCSVKLMTMVDQIKKEFGVS